MEEQIVSFETAKLAKEKGFDEVTDIIYDTDCNNCYENLLSDI